ncbi:MAG TPA: hypothetical protein VNI83_02105 [Vicinamibacterales bacterium]|nr:hypothetical protein [Vicinamibacterales bacterium]
MPIPAGVIVGWPGTAASIPSGWSRKTALDSRFLKSIPNASTNPGTTGGSATHTHTTQAHSHTINHGHTAQGTSAAAGASALGDSGIASDADMPGNHTHAVPDWPSTTINSGTAAPTTDAISNDPAHWSVIWIESNGTPSGIPDGAMAFWPTSSVPSGWTQATNGKNRFLKGAATGGDGGGTNAGNAAHTHSVGHTHTSDHTHAAATSGGSGLATGGWATGLNQIGSANHTHQVSGENANFGASQSANLTTIAGTVEPPWHKLAIIQNTSGGTSAPTSIICVWTGTLASIPSGWVLCDGNNGTPNLLGKFIKGADTLSEIGNTGGAVGHSHTANAHTHTWSSTSHSHTASFSNHSIIGITDGEDLMQGGHGSGHNVVGSSATVGTVGNATPTVNNTADTQPQFYEVAFIQLQVTAITLTPSPVVANVAVPAPAFTFGALNLAPSPTQALLGVPSPALNLRLTLAPAATVLRLAVPQPVVTLGALVLTPSPVQALLVPTAPNMIRGLTLTPAPVVIDLTSPPPAFTFGAVVLTPDAVVVEVSIGQAQYLLFLQRPLQPGTAKLLSELGQGSARLQGQPEAGHARSGAPPPSGEARWKE